MRCSPAVTTCVAVDNLATGRRERVQDAARFEEADIRDGAALNDLFGDARPDVCFHLAAQADVRVSVERPDYDADVNLLGTIRVLEAARSVGAQVVFSSTGGAIYGECERPAREDDPRAPFSPYGASKLAAEEYLATWNRLYGSEHVALRYGNVFGPRQDPHGEAGVVAIFFGRLAEGRPVTIFGDGSPDARLRLRRRRRRGDASRPPAIRPGSSTSGRAARRRCSSSTTGAGA